MESVDAVEKKDGTPVTVADFGAQAFMCQAIAEAFPADSIVAEEDSQELRDNPQLMQRVTEYVNRFTEGAHSPKTVCDWIDRGGGEVEKRFWTLDPIDGTKEFLRGGFIQHCAGIDCRWGGKTRCAGVPESTAEMG